MRNWRSKLCLPSKTCLLSVQQSFFLFQRAWRAENQTNKHKRNSPFWVKSQRIRPTTRARASSGGPHPGLDHTTRLVSSHTGAFRDDTKNVWVTLDIPSQYMHYCVVLLCGVYCVIVEGLGIVVFFVTYLEIYYSLGICCTSRTSAKESTCRVINACSWNIHWQVTCHHFDV